MLEYIQRLAWDPTAPVPDGWPHGWWGVLLLFCLPGGMGIPPGVLLGHHGGLGVVPMTVLYFLSDVFLAACYEPMLIVLAALARVVPALERAGRGFMAMVTRMLPPGSLAGPVGVGIASFGGGLPVGRALAAGAGFPFIGGWLLAIAGDMVYFLIGLVSTLWFDGIFGDQRVAAVAGLAVMFIVPGIVHRLRAASVRRAQD